MVDKKPIFPSRKLASAGQVLWSLRFKNGILALCYAVHAFEPSKLAIFSGGAKTPWKPRISLNGITENLKVSPHHKFANAFPVGPFSHILAQMVKQPSKSQQEWTGSSRMCGGLLEIRCSSATRTACASLPPVGLAWMPTAPVFSISKPEPGVSFPTSMKIQ